MTPAVSKLKKSGIQFTLNEYDHDPGIRGFGQEAAQKLGLPENQIFKTLVVDIQGKGLAVAVVPVSEQLDLKAVAKALGGKKASMADKGRVEKNTGYLTGGVSPIGQKKMLPTLIDASAKEFEQIWVSGGRRGLQISLSPSDLAQMTRATFYSLSR